MQFWIFAQQFILAVLVGALIGIEREHARAVVKKKEFPIFGMRTTILFAMLGFLTSFTSNLVGSSAIIIAGVVLALIITTTVYASNVFVHKYTGSTTYIAMLIVFFSGLFVGLGGYINYVIAVTLSIATTLLLASKRIFVNWTRKLTNEEIISAVKFGIIAFIILPLLPNRYIDPWGIINPYKIWYVIVAISVIYFVSYILMKELSQKGLIISAFFGGLVNGSATAYQLADWLRRKKSLLKPVLSGVFVACFTGLFGDLVVILLVFNNLRLLRYLLLPYTVAMVFVLAYSYIMYKSYKGILPKKLNLKSPFALKPVLIFGMFYLALVFFGGLLSIYFGQLGLLPTTLGGSLFSSSAVIASLANLSNQNVISVAAAAKFVVLAASTSLIIKVFWVHNALNKKLSKSVAIGVLLAAVSMFVALYFQLLIFP